MQSSWMNQTSDQRRHGGEMAEYRVRGPCPPVFTCKSWYNSSFFPPPFLSHQDPFSLPSLMSSTCSPPHSLHVSHHNFQSKILYSNCQRAQNTTVTAFTWNTVHTILSDYLCTSCVTLPWQACDSASFSVRGTAASPPYGPNGWNLLSAWLSYACGAT